LATNVGGGGGGVGIKSTMGIRISDASILLLIKRRFLIFSVFTALKSFWKYLCYLRGPLQPSSRKILFL